MHWAVRLFVCSSVAKMRTKKRDFLKTEQFGAMVPIDDQQKVLHVLLKEPIIGP